MSPFLIKHEIAKMPACWQNEDGLEVKCCIKETSIRILARNFSLVLSKINPLARLIHMRFMSLTHPRSWGKMRTASKLFSVRTVPAHTLHWRSATSVLCRVLLCSEAASLAAFLSFVVGPLDLSLHEYLNNRVLQEDRWPAVHMTFAPKPTEEDLTGKAPQRQVFLYFRFFQNMTTLPSPSPQGGSLCLYPMHTANGFLSMRIKTRKENE